MSAPGSRAHQAENLEYGFLAARALEAIERKLDRETLSEADVEALAKAHAFLRDVVEGASLVTGSEFHGHSDQVVTALRYAARPMQGLRTAVTNDEEFLEFFRQLANALQSPDPDADTLQEARSFFSVMFSLLKDAMRQNESPLVGKTEFNLRPARQSG